MGTCTNCTSWVTLRATAYGDGTTIENWKAAEGKGHCDALAIETAPDFGCSKFMFGENHVLIEQKIGAPWQHFKMIPCPDCDGGKAGSGEYSSPLGGRGHRCAGTGQVRLYDDGYVGDEQTRMHPKEKEHKPAATCHSCAVPVEPGWAHCPSCGAKLWKVAETHVVSDADQNLPPVAL